MSQPRREHGSGLCGGPERRNRVTPSDVFKTAALSVAVFIVTLALMTKTGVASMPADGTLFVYGWTRDALGPGIAFLMWNGLFSIGLAIALVYLPRLSEGERTPDGTPRLSVTGSAHPPRV